MTLTEQDKQKILKACTNILKSINGKGPKNIYAKYSDDVIQFVIQGIITDYEKHLIKNFGDEAIETFSDYYERDSTNFEKALNEELSNDLNIKDCFKFFKLDSDFHKDIFIYHMRIECNQMHT